MDHYSEAFERMKAELHEKGYQENDVTITSGKAMVLGALYGLPFVIVFGLLYRFFLIERAHLLEVSGIAFYVMFIEIIAVSVVIHELLHGVAWAAASGKGWNVVRFNINAMMPSCACKAVLEKRAYLVGVMAPFIVLGFGSVLFIFIYPGTVSLLTMMVNFVSAGADLMIAFHARKERDDCLIADHPTEAGYIIFYR